MDSAQLVANNTTPTQASTTTSDEMQWWKKFSINQGLLLHKGRVCVPSDDDIKHQILYECHASPSVGHRGIKKTYALVQRHFYWPQMHKSVEHYVVHCQQRQVNKAQCLKVGGLLQSLEILEGKWESISMDFIVGLPNTQRGHDAIWVVVDCLTKMAKFIPTKTTVSTPKLARLYMDQLYGLYGLPSSIVSDRDRKFNNHFWRAVFANLDTKLNLSTTVLS